ncbi:glyoxylase-like metal-dependent hydrolase (beta-lactamase superfamily II) [Neolewinella xylanilytica]|uniref:Glyoxylase-like metal-dependent hydrolase (Beta-lactamase superfamily II) n=1 Tax=Neolewinella xylanilytica TaxID=1514080 RepID=A0A2S6I5Z7_9BACT|nr:MBL fold metallo-hydrolase [Neolewinella xylanilytica]PPK86587.1 glyoxylase-like metal-dependent hydrolase (beta-lactamase superfamily II) [Neolewinella xylanilytica]
MVNTIDLLFLNKPKAIAAFAIPDDQGYTLVECGPFSTHHKLLAGLEAIGASPDRVHTLLLSHIHFDHAGAAWWWAQQGTQVYVHPRGLKHMISPERLYDSARQIYGDRMDTLWGKMERIDPERIQAVEDRQQLTIGGRQWVGHHTPGHASHHLAWQLGRSVFTGDVGGCRIANGPVVPPCPPPDFDADAWRASIERLRSLNASEFFLTHYGRITDTDDHLDELLQRLEGYVDWMEPYYRDGASAETIEPMFKQYVTEELTAHGVGDDDLESYLAANPPYMSVTGLLRWLRKRDERLH